MTKKSINRLKRDATRKEAEQHLENNTIWDDLTGAYEGCAKALGQHKGIALMLQRKEVFPYLKDFRGTIGNIQAVTRDLVQLNEELKTIHAQHAKKTGGSQDPDEVVQSIQIFEQYHLFLQRHDAVVMPAVYHILEDFGQAEKAFEAAHAEPERTVEELASDPNHTDPIDVAFTEVKPANTEQNV